jgi:hypothetical protein
MTDENDNNNVDIDLDEFETDFFNPSGAVKEQEEVEEVAETEVNPLATEDEDEDEPEVEEEEADDDEDELEEVPQLKVKRNRAQERIEQLLERERLANDRAHALELRLAALEAGKEVKQKEEAPALREQLPADAPNPDAKDEDGNPIYELGEFDPHFIRDLTKFTIEQETKAAKERAELETYETQMNAAREEIKSKWIDSLDKAETELPDIRENVRGLTEVFQNIEPNYGEYLASTIMASDYGPHIMNYLSQNIGEAQKIVASGPAAATLALGRLEARFIQTSTQQEEKRNTRQVSKASEPPAARTRGAHGQFSVAPDTDDLDAFERAFFPSN